MPLYTFYPIRQGGDSMAFEAVELADDEQARIYAAKVLSRHDSAVEVMMWAGDRRLGALGVPEPAE